MSKGLICDRCGAVYEGTNVHNMYEIKMTPYRKDVRLTADSKTKYFDLCKDCTETLMQYINNEVDMVIFNDREAADDKTEHSDTSL